MASGCDHFDQLQRPVIPHTFNCCISFCSWLVTQAIFPPLPPATSPASLHLTLILSPEEGLGGQQRISKFLLHGDWVETHCIVFLYIVRSQKACMGRGIQILGYYYLLRRRQWHPTPVLVPWKSHQRRSLVGCSLWGR